MILCGIDEAGRGPLAGPVVAAALVFPANIQITGLDDSKKIPVKRREKLDVEIREKALSFGIGVSEVSEIDRINILQATFKAMQRALDALEGQPDYLIVDGRDFPRFFLNGKTIPGEAVIKGDGKSAAIAGASILAKVYRDNLMRQYAEAYPEYGFEKHKGYGTRYHLAKILELGPLPLHREKFIRSILNHNQQTQVF